MDADDLVYVRIERWKGGTWFRSVLWKFRRSRARVPAVLVREALKAVGVLR